MIKFGEAIKTHREKARLTQVALARKVGIVPSYLSAIENDRKEPSLTLIRQIGSALKVAPEVLFWESVQLRKDLPRQDRKTIELAKVLIRHYFQAD
jgi:DNA-binding XRE family transcriptional regulator